MDFTIIADPLLTHCWPIADPLLVIAQYLDIRTLTLELILLSENGSRREPFILLARFDKSAFHLIEIYTVISIIHFSNK